MNDEIENSCFPAVDREFRMKKSEMCLHDQTHRKTTRLHRAVKNTLVVFIFILTLQPQFAGDANSKNLENRLKTAAGKEKVDILNALAQEYLLASPAKATECADQASAMAKDLKYAYGEARAALNRAKIYRNQNNYDLALKLLETGIKKFKTAGAEPLVAECLIECGLNCFMKSDIDPAMRYFNQALQISMKSHDNPGISIAYYNLGRCYRKTGKLDLALETSLKSLHFNPENNHNALNTISIIYAMTGELDKALEYQKQALAVREKLALYDDIIGSLNNLGLISIRGGHFQEGLEYLLKSAKVAEETDKYYHLNKTLNNIGVLYEEKLNQPEKAMPYYQKSIVVSRKIGDNFEIANTQMNIGNLQSKLKKYSQGIDNLEKALDLAKKIKAIELEMNGYLSISQHHERMNNYQRALENYKLHIAHRDSIMNRDAKNKISEMQIKYETEKKEKENEIFRLRIERSKLLKARLYFIIVIFMIVVMLLFYLVVAKNKSNRMLRKEIRERKKLESELKLEQEKLLAANKELEAFSYSVSHDLRAPLRAVNGFTHILMQDYVSKLDDEAKRLGSLIQGNTSRMKKLIDDLLAFSRLGRTAINPTRINMTEMVNNVFLEAGNAQERKRIQFSLSELPEAMGDPNMIKVVWVNLISNAIKFSARRKRSIISVTFRIEKDRLIYSIKDNGSGFDMKYKEDLFGVFKRLHSEKEFEGTGVGLALVQRVIHRHGGRIWAEGILDEGATFHFTLHES